VSRYDSEWLADIIDNDLPKVEEGVERLQLKTDSSE